MKVKTKFIYILPLVLWCFPIKSLGNSLTLPKDLVREILAEAVPSAGPLEGLSIGDYEVYFEGEPPPAMSATLENGSLQWVRILEVLVLPRARLHLQFAQPTRIRATHGSFVTAGANLNSLDLPVALLTTPQNQVRLTYDLDGSQKEAVVRFRLKKDPVSGGLDRIYVDSSCSRFVVSGQWKKKQSANPSLIYLGCRFISTKGDAYRTSAMEMYVVWDKTDSVSAVSIAGISTEATLPSLWTLRLSAQPGLLHFRSSQEEEWELHYVIPNRHFLGFLGVGLGPYASEFNGVGEFEQGIKPLLTVYGSVFMSETLRVVGFDATLISDRLWTDFGLYLSTENTKMFDQRLTMNLLFGGHIIGFRTDGKTHAVPSFPQGFEFIYADAFVKGHSMSFGGFIYPEISGRSYHNLWLRWGGKIFGEINYLAAKESFNEESVTSKNLGLTFGFPLARFW